MSNRKRNRLTLEEQYETIRAECARVNAAHDPIYWLAIPASVARLIAAGDAAALTFIRDEAQAWLLRLGER